MILHSGSGQAFIHDPRVSSNPSTETKGKIRLRFHAGNGSSITVSRLFTLNNKKAKDKQDKQQYKQLEGAVEINAKGQSKKTINKCELLFFLLPTHFPCPPLAHTARSKS